MINMGNLAKIATVRIYRQGTVIIKEKDESAGELFILLNGNVGIFKNIESGAPVKLAMVGEGSTFGEMSLFSDEPRSAAAIALTNVTAAVVSREHFLEFIKLNPDLAEQMVERLCNRLEDAYKKINRLEAEAKPPKERSQKPIKVSPVLNGALYPEGHKSYPQVMPEVFNEYMADAVKICPYCKNKFHIKKPLALKLKGGAPLDWDMRIHNTDFDRIWTNVITCPNCYFSCLIDYFDDESLIYRTPEIMLELEQMKEGISLDFDALRTMDLVFACHYLALFCSRDFRNERQIKAKLWMQLTYLYSDAGDDKMYHFAVDNAFKSYRAFYGSSDMSPDREQICCLVLAYLSMEMGDLELSMRYLTAVRMNREGLPAYKRMADSKIEDLRALRRKR